MRSLSYFHGVSTEPLIGVTIPDYLERITAADPDREAIVSCFQNKRLSYADLNEQSDLLALSLLSAGIEPGDRVGIWSTNNYQWFVIFMAVAKLGAVLVNINPGYQPMELEYALNQSGLKLLFTLATNRKSDYFAMLDKLSPHLFNTGLPRDGSSVTGLETIVFLEEHGGASNEHIFAYDQFLSLAGSRNRSELAPFRKRISIDSPVNIQYTSGTTGQPKGVTLSHHNIINNAYLAAKAMQVEPESRFCVPMPFYHCGGMISSALATLSVGGTVVIPGPFFEELPTLEALQKESCTHLSGVPTMFIAQLEHPRFAEFDLSSLKSGFMAGAPCPVELMKQVADRMHMHDVVILYGLTESSPLMTATTIDDTLEIRATTVGRAIAHAEVKIIDTETGEIVERGVQGEICCRGHLVMLGYWQNREATDATIDSGRWLHSGDLGTMNENGYVNITGRKKDMIARGGENVYPREIEEVLHRHPDISQAQVFGVPDHKLGEEVALWVVLKAGAALEPSDIKEWLKERVSYFKVPKYIKVVDQYPMTVTGKIRKFKMREAMIEELNLQSEAEIQTA